MEFYSELEKKIAQGGKATIEQAKKITEITKLNILIEDLDKENAKIYERIGKKYFEKCKEENVDEELMEDFREVIENLTKINEYNVQIRRIKGIIQCPYCGVDLEEEKAVFCGNCGRMLKHRDKIYQEETNEEKICPYCGTKAEGKQKFCMQCGQKFENTKSNCENVILPEKEIENDCIIIEKYCMGCGEKLESDEEYCPMCGKKYEDFQ